MPHQFGNSDAETGVTGKTEGPNSAGVAGFYEGTQPLRQRAPRVSPRPPSGVLGVHNGNAAQDTTGSGVRGESHNGDGVVGTAASHFKTGVFGVNESKEDAVPPEGSGVFGLTMTRGGVGVFGANNSGRSGRGVQGNGPEAGVGGYSAKGFGVIGYSDGGDGVYGSTGFRFGVVGRVLPTVLNDTTPDAAGFDPGNPPASAGVYGTSIDPGGTAVFGRHEGRGGRGVQGVGEFVGVGGFSEQFVGVVGESPGGTGVQGTGRYGMAAVGRSVGILATNRLGDFHGQSPASTRSCAVFAHGDLPLYLQTTGEDFVIGWRDRPAVDDQIPNVFRIDKYGTGFFPQLQATGADVAEFFETGVVIDAGSVVEIDPDCPGGLRLCSTAHCTTVAGVLSSAPGVILGGGNDVNATARLALAGRIPVKASAENGAIKPGDLLVASSISGHAMASSLPAKPGTIIGKALGKLDQGQAMIQMLVMLG